MSRVVFLPKQEWVKDKEVQNCFKCKKAFSFLTRKHHCRVCGSIFCKDCASNRSYSKRVCDYCTAKVQATSIEGDGPSQPAPPQPNAGGAPAPKPKVPQTPAPTPASQSQAPAQEGDAQEGGEGDGEDWKKDDSDDEQPAGVNESSGLDISEFELLKVVGKGSFAKVMQVRKKDTGRIYALKVLQKEKIVKRKKVVHTNTERRILEEIEHPFIVRLRFAFQNQQKLYLVLDYFNGGELFFHLKESGRFDVERARFYAAEITLALQCLHENDIVYRDLKPENVLLDALGHVRLTDFGLAKSPVNADNKATTFCGTPEYLAPEVIRKLPYGKEVDWWSLGCLLYEMLTGWPPFTDDNHRKLYKKVLQTEPEWPNYVPAIARKTIEGLMAKERERRLGSNDQGKGGGWGAEEVKKHLFFASIDFKQLYRKKITPPFKPVITRGLLDVGNVDEEFKGEIPADTPADPSAFLGRSVGNSSNVPNFPGFTFIPAGSLLDVEPRDDMLGSGRQLELPRLSDDEDGERAALAEDSLPAVGDLALDD